jgi:hypothetical protein
MESYFDETLSRHVSFPNTLFVMDLPKRPQKKIVGGAIKQKEATIDFRELMSRKTLFTRFLFMLYFHCENANIVTRYIVLSPEKIPRLKFFPEEEIGKKMNDLALERFGGDLSIMGNREAAKKLKKSVIVREYGGGGPEMQAMMRIWHTFVGKKDSLKFPIAEVRGDFVPEYDQENNPGGFVYSLLE